MKLIIFDAIDKQAASYFWPPGAAIYKTLGKATHSFGAKTINEGLNWIASQEEEIQQIEWWVHGRPGMFLIGKDAFTSTDMRSTPVIEMLNLVGGLMAKDAVFWIRSCSSFAGPIGKSFASDLAYRLDRRAAGHTYRIGAFQSGLRICSPGEDAPWSSNEGEANGIYGDAYPRPWAPRTVTALTNKIPKDW